MDESDRILSSGARLALPGGAFVALRFPLLALKRLEDEYGTLGEAARRLNHLGDQPYAMVGEGGKLAEPWSEPALADLLAFLTVASGDADIGDRVMHPGDAVEALFEAWKEAFPVPEDDKGDDGGAGEGGGKAAAAGSRGGSSTTPPRSGSAAQTTSSGG